MKCKHIKSNGESCGGFTPEGSQFCWRHDPKISPHEKKAASAKGGKNKGPGISETGTELIIASTKDVSGLLVDTIGNMRKGVFSPRLGSAIGYLAYILVRTYELTEVENRLLELEDRLNHFDYITIHPEFKNESDKGKIAEGTSTN
ncbi:MAG: hypothetical protein ABSF32_06380 [Ignavibacteria bacterium]|jgi:hypothetical protein